MYAYDIEIFKNFFSVTFIKISDPNIQRYIDADIDDNVSLKKQILKSIDHRIFIVFYDVFGNDKYNRNDLVTLRNFLKANETVTFAGYNNRHYDDFVLSFIVKYKQYVTVQEFTREVYKLSQELITYDGYNFAKDSSYYITANYKSIDLMKLNYLDRLRISLKQVSISLKWYRVEDYTMPDATIDQVDVYREYNYPSITLDTINELKSFDRIVHYDYVQGIIDYNINDVLITEKLYQASKKELIERINVYNEFDVFVLSDSRSTTADKILTQLYSNYTGMKWQEFSNLRTFRSVINIGKLLVPNIKFKSKEMNSFLGTLATTKVLLGTDTFEELILYNNVGYTMALGGLHSIDKGGNFRSTDSIKYMEFDVNSFYPALAVAYGFKPKHLSNIILQILKDVMDSRLKAKASGDKSKADIYKIIINAIYGKFGSKMSWLFDSNAMYSVTINGQLMLLMLIERLEMAGFKTISANTDGVVSKIPVERMIEYKSICSQWEKDTKLTGGYNDYKIYVRTNVNSYLSVLENGGIKKKNDFIDEPRIDKAYRHPIIPIALNKYYIDDIPIEETIKNHRDIYDFLISQKTGSQFVNQYHSIKDAELDIQEIQKNIRYYVSKTGGILMKYSKENDKYINVLKGKNVTIFNTYFKVKEFSDYKINYSFYIAKCYDIINRVNNSFTKQIKKSGGSMFDEFL